MIATSIKELNLPNIAGQSRRQVRCRLAVRNDGENGNPSFSGGAQ
ncbi:hypothetical protein GA0061105_103349 [Rhizobium aethiopicum]|uniref:Uncharacterized protein n=1 Tax=Rhizobium aethiopicum TaxID=1138170 RepID=A0A1C3Y074_9HYPH|nr:hypothetical protein GA0061105_103349 [Rhizobium aethiopicum]